MSSQQIPLLQANQISKTFYQPTKNTLFKDLSLSVYAGTSVAIIGRSGAGKSSLLQVLGLLEEPCQGTMHVGGKKVNFTNRNRFLNKEFGFIFQSFHLLEDYTTLENVLMPARIAREETHHGSYAEQRAFFLLEQVGLTHRAHYNTKLLSGGEKQRVALARAMCNDPCLLLADEPSGNLDKETAQMIHEILLKFSQQPGKALVIVTHDHDLAQLCSEQYELREGQLHPIKQQHLSL